MAILLFSKMLTGPVTIFAFSLATILPDIVHSENHHTIIANLMSFGLTDLAIFTDDTGKIGDLIDPEQIPAKLYDVNQLNFDLARCPEGGYSLKFRYYPFYTRPAALRHHTVVVYATLELEKILKIFDNTVLNCSFILEPGIYNIDTRFLFIVDENESITKYSEELFAASPHISKHRWENCVGGQNFVPTLKISSDLIWNIPNFIALPLKSTNENIFKKWACCSLMTDVWDRGQKKLGFCISWWVIIGKKVCATTQVNSDAQKSATEKERPVSSQHEDTQFLLASSSDISKPIAKLFVFNYLISFLLFYGSAVEWFKLSHWKPLKWYSHNFPFHIVNVIINIVKTIFWNILYQACCHSQETLSEQIQIPDIWIKLGTERINEQGKTVIHVGWKWSPSIFGSWILWRGHYELQWPQVYGIQFKLQKWIFLLR